MAWPPGCSPADQESWEHQAEARVEANTRRVDEVMSVLEQTSGALASVQQAVVGLNQQVGAVAGHVTTTAAETARALGDEREASARARQDLLGRVEAVTATGAADAAWQRIEEEVADLREELLLKQAALAGAVREALDGAAAAQTQARMADADRVEQHLAALTGQVTAVTAGVAAVDGLAGLGAQLEEQQAALAETVRGEVQALAGLPAQFDAQQQALVDTVRAELQSVVELSARVDAQQASLAEAVRGEVQALAGCRRSSMPSNRRWWTRCGPSCSRWWSSRLGSMRSRRRWRRRCGVRCRRWRVCAQFDASNSVVAGAVRCPATGVGGHGAGRAAVGRGALGSGRCAAGVVGGCGAG